MTATSQPRFHGGLEFSTAPTVQDGESFALPSLWAQQLDRQCLIHLPVEILGNILLEWAKIQWDAPVIARQVCGWLKLITDNNPRVWSKLFVDKCTTREKVSKWLTLGKAVPKEIFIDTEDIYTVSVALEGARDAMSLMYTIPPGPGPRYRLTPLPSEMPELRHLRLDGFLNRYLHQNDIFAFHGSGMSGYFPRLTVLHLMWVNLDLFATIKWDAVFPNVRELALQNVGDGPAVLNLINACSTSLEQLRVINHLCHMDWNSSHCPRISLPKLKVLVVECSSGTGSHFDTPDVHVIYANLCDLDGAPGSFDSVVEWTTRWSTGHRPHMDITRRLKSMPRLRHLVLAESGGILKSCFKLLRDHPSVCPDLHWIEVAHRTNFSINTKEYLKACVAPRAASVPGFALEFVPDDCQQRLFNQYYSIRVCLLTLSVS
jgi:hypothetical protein